MKTLTFFILFVSLSCLEIEIIGPNKDPLNVLFNQNPRQGSFSVFTIETKVPSGFGGFLGKDSISPFDDIFSKSPFSPFDDGQERMFHSKILTRIGQNV